MRELKLKPMEVGDILDTAFQLYKNNFIKFIQIMAPAYIFNCLLGLSWQYIATQINPNPETASQSIDMFNIGLILVGFVSMVIVAGMIFLFRLLAIGALVHSVSGAYLGKDIQWKEAYKNILRQLWPLLGLGLLSWLMISIGNLMLWIPGLILTVFLAS